MWRGERRTRLLIVDDEADFRAALARRLEKRGAVVTQAANGEEALASLAKESVDVVLLDVRMPGMDGLEALVRIRAIQPDVPIILFTSFDDICTRDTRCHCATACVEKRGDLSELKQVVAAALASRRQNRPYRLGLPPAALSASPIS